MCDEESVFRGLLDFSICARGPSWESEEYVAFGYEFQVYLHPVFVWALAVDMEEVGEERGYRGVSEVHDEVCCVYLCEHIVTYFSYGVWGSDVDDSHDGCGGLESAGEVVVDPLMCCAYV